VGLELGALDLSKGIFGGVSNFIQNLMEAKNINTWVQQNLQKTKKPGKAARAGKNKGKKPAARGSKAKGKNKGSKKKASGGIAKVKEDSSKKNKN